MGVKPGREVLARNDGVSAWGTVTTLAESPVQAGLLWAGTDDGLVQVVRDGGQDVDRTSPSACPARRERAASAASSRRIATRGPSTSRSTVTRTTTSRRICSCRATSAQTWKTLVDGAAARSAGSTSSRSTRRARTCCSSGTETGLFVSLDGGAGWTRFTARLPDGAGGRPGGPPARQRPRRRHPRPRASTSSTTCRRWRGLTAEVAACGPAPVHAASRRSIVPAVEARELQRATGVRRAQSAVWRDPHLPREDRVEGTGGHHHPRRRGCRRPDAWKARPRPGFNRVVWDLRGRRARRARPASAGRSCCRAPTAATVRVGERESKATLSRDARPGARPVSDADRRLRFQFLTDVLGLQRRRSPAPATTCARCAIS